MDNSQMSEKQSAQQFWKTIFYIVLAAAIVFLCWSYYVNIIKPADDAESNLRRTEQAIMKQEQHTSEAKTVTREMYLEIVDGMSYEDVIRITGAPGKAYSSSKLMGVSTDCIVWENGDRSHMMVMFQNNRVVSKEETRL